MDRDFAVAEVAELDLYDTPQEWLQASAARKAYERTLAIHRAVSISFWTLIVTGILVAIVSQV